MKKIITVALCGIVLASCDSKKDEAPTIVDNKTQKQEKNSSASNGKTMTQTTKGKAATHSAKASSKSDKAQNVIIEIEGTLYDTSEGNTEHYAKTIDSSGKIIHSEIKKLSSAGYALATDAAGKLIVKLKKQAQGASDYYDEIEYSAVEMINNIKEDPTYKITAESIDNIHARSVQRLSEHMEQSEGFKTFDNGVKKVWVEVLTPVYDYSVLSFTETINLSVYAWTGLKKLNNMAVLLLEDASIFSVKMFKNVSGKAVLLTKDGIEVTIAKATDIKDDSIALAEKYGKKIYPLVGQVIPQTGRNFKLGIIGLREMLSQTLLDNPQIEKSISEKAQITEDFRLQVVENWSEMMANSKNFKAVDNYITNSKNVAIANLTDYLEESEDFHVLDENVKVVHKHAVSRVSNWMSETEWFKSADEGIRNFYKFMSGESKE